MKISYTDSKIETKLTMTAILLAGGKSSRMQKDKAFLKLGGRFLVERSLEVLQSIFAEVLISSNYPELFEAFNVRVIPDLIRDQGPLGGLYTGLKTAVHEFCFFVACDMPFIQADVIRYLAQYAHGCDIVVPRDNFGLHPLHAYYRRSCLPYIENNLETKHLKIIDFYSDCMVRYVESSELATFGTLSKIFCNINTPEEWAKIKDLI